MGTVNLIPVMTSDTTPSGIASASYVANGSYAAWKAFDSPTSTYWAAGSTLPSWLRYEFSTPQTIGKYAITNDIVSTHPSAWNFQSSNDGITWITLDTRTNEVFSIVGERKEYSFVNRVKYKQYRLLITAKGSTGNVTIRTLEMYEYDWLNKFLISLGDGSVESISSAQDSSNLIPIMTSNTAPSGIASGSSQFQDYWYLFDGVDSTRWQSYNATLPQWVAYEFPTAKKVNKYALSTVSTLEDRMPVDWTFEGWNGVSWIVLDTRVGITSWSRNLKKEFEFINEVAYIKYRIYITKRNGNGSYTSIGELAMMYRTPPFKKNLSSTAEQNFISHGMNKSAILDLTLQLNKKSFVEQSASVLGSGKLFKKTIDTSKVPIKKATIT